MNVDQKTPDGEVYKRYQYPHIFGSRVNRGDEELAKSKFPSMLGVVEDDSDVGSRCYSRQSSVVSQWEDRVVSGDEDGGPESKRAALFPLTQTAKEAGFNFHDMSKAIPENIRHQPHINPVWRAGQQQDEKVFHFIGNEPGDSPFISDIVSEAKRNEHGSPKVRKHVVQLNNTSGNQPSFHPLHKRSSWAVAAGGVQNLDVSVKDKDDIISCDQKFYLMESSNNSKVNNDPNLCDTLNEANDNHNVFENCRLENDEQFKKCTNNGWTENNHAPLDKHSEVSHGSVHNGSHCEKENSINEDEGIHSHSGDDVKKDDFSFDPEVKEMHNMNENAEEKTNSERTNQFSPDKSAELFLKSLISDTEVIPEKSEGPIWILPPDEGTKRKSKKKKKPRA